MKTLAKVLAALLATLAALVYMAVFYDRLPGQSSFDLDLATIRSLIKDDGAALPDSVHSLTVARGYFPGCLVITGCGDGRYDLEVRVFQLVFADGFSVIIDPVHDRALNEANALLMKQFDDDAYAAMQAAMLRADAIVFSHEHFDHIGGVVKSVNLEQLLPAVVITAEQQANAEQMGMSYPQALRDIEPLRYDKYHRLAPGVVLIKAPGHTPGSQMLFVRLDTGRELLFIGDTVWNKANLLQQRTKPLLTNWVVGEAGMALAQQIRRLIELYQQQDITLVVHHDPDWLADYERQGWLQPGLL